MMKQSLTATTYLNLMILDHLLRKKNATFVESCVINARIARARDMQFLCHYAPEIYFTMDMEKYMSDNFKDFNLIDYRLSDDQLDDFDLWVKDNSPKFGECLLDLAANSYKVSFTFVEKNASWCVSITGQKSARVNTASTLTTWSEDPIEAFEMGFYKVALIFKWGAWKTKQQSRRG
jgi:hypothetical protein